MWLINLLTFYLIQSKSRYKKPNQTLSTPTSMKIFTAIVIVVIMACLTQSKATMAQNPVPEVSTAKYFDISPPLRDMVNQAPTTAETSWKDGIVKNKFNVLPKPDAPIPGARGTGPRLLCR